MLTRLLIVVILALSAFLGVAALQPADFSLSRSIDISASPSEVFAHVNNFHDWEAWSPWAKLDPSMKQVYEGPTQGEGSIYSWAGSGKVGEGKMTILKSQTPELVQIQLDFLKPMQATNLTVFTFKPAGQGTHVTWTMSGHNNLFAKALHLLMSMEKMVGPSFEQGLSKLKTLSEAAPKKP